MTEIQKRLFALQDKKYRDFTVKLMPTVDPETVIGVRSPALKQLSKELQKEQKTSEILNALPHRYFEEYGLHASFISSIRDFDTTLDEIEKLLPYIDNWAICDSLSPAAFKKNPDRLIPEIERWLKSERVYTVRFGIKCLMSCFLDERFDPRYPEMVAAVRSDDYYVNMMIAWYFATALAKQYEAALPYIENRRLEKWAHNKAIRKAIESYRVTDEHKTYLKTLRWK